MDTVPAAVLSNSFKAGSAEFVTGRLAHGADVLCNILSSWFLPGITRDWTQ